MTLRVRRYVDACRRWVRREAVVYRFAGPHRRPVLVSVALRSEGFGLRCFDCDGPSRSCGCPPLITDPDAIPF